MTLTVLQQQLQQEEKQAEVRWKKEFLVLYKTLMINETIS